MKNTAFLAFMMILFSALMALRSAFNEAISPVKQLEARVAHLEEQKRQIEFRHELAVHQHAEFQQYVASLIPNVLRGKSASDGYPLRSLASVVTASDRLVIERASGLMERAKSLFRDKQFEDSNALFGDLINQYPESAHVIEAHFLLAEGCYQLREFERAIETIEKMISLYPESDLTGYALLRLGRIFETQDRLEDAADIYRAVISSFRNSDIVGQARSNLKGVAL